jgi:hypothetical protein
MAPQPLEKIESVPGNGWARKPRTYKMWYTGAGDRARFRLTGREKDEVAEKGA